MSTKDLADGLARKHGTRNPFVIAEALGFIIIFIPLTDIRGFQQTVKRRHIIYINEKLDEQQQRLVCAHELAHHLLHSGLNRVFMDKNTYSVAQKYENEANHFAVNLIYSDEELWPYLSYSYECAAAFMGVSNELAAYRIKKVIPEKLARQNLNILIAGD